MHTRLISKDDKLFLQVDDGELRPVLAGWESFTGWYWFAVEIEDSYCYGCVQGFEEEWGYFDSEEIEASHICWKINPCDLPHAGRRRLSNGRLLSKQDLEVPAGNLCGEQVLR